MARRKKVVETLAEQEYRKVLDDFTEERGRIADVYFEARKRCDITRCNEIFEYWKGVVRKQHEWVARTPSPLPAD